MLFHLPIKLLMGKRVIKSHSLNLNNYRNAPYHLLSDLKISFNELLEPQLRGKKFQTPFVIEYKLFMGSARRVDLSNVCSIVDKFFCDSLVNYGVIEDDSTSFLKSVTYSYGGIDRENPRVEARLLPYTELEQ